MKIAYIYPEILPSKKARAISIINSANELASISNCTLFVDANSQKDILKQYDINQSNLKISFIRKNYFGIKSNKLFNQNLLRELEKEKFDFIYARHLKVANYLIKKGFKVIYECHEFFQENNPKIKFMENYTLNKSFGVVFINQYLQNLALKKYALKNVKVIRNGCGFNLQYIKKDFSQINKIYYIGNFFKWKGVDFLINSLNCSSINIYIIGDGDRRDELKQKSSKNINFLGFKKRNEIESILKNSKLTVIPNIPTKDSEFSTPIKLYEYLASSNIILSANMETIKEIITDGHNGFLFKAGDENDFKEKLKYILSLNSKKLELVSKNAYETSKEFTWENRAKNIIQFLEELKNDNTPSSK